jgi:hypothetical protein
MSLYGVPCCDSLFVSVAEHLAVQQYQLWSISPLDNLKQEFETLNITYHPIFQFGCYEAQISL